VTDFPTSPGRASTRRPSSSRRSRSRPLPPPRSPTFPSRAALDGRLHGRDETVPGRPPWVTTGSFGARPHTNHADGLARSSNVWHRIEGRRQRRAGGTGRRTGGTKARPLAWEGREVLVEARTPRASRSRSSTSASRLLLDPDPARPHLGGGGSPAERYRHLQPSSGPPRHPADDDPTGEIQPHYVQWYGFYEGHTEWRVDPIGHRARLRPADARRDRGRLPRLPRRGADRPLHAPNRTGLAFLPLRPLLRVSFTIGSSFFPRAAVRGAISLSAEAPNFL